MDQDAYNLSEKDIYFYVQILQPEFSRYAGYVELSLEVSNMAHSICGDNVATDSLKAVLVKPSIEEIRVYSNDQDIEGLEIAELSITSDINLEISSTQGVKNSTKGSKASLKLTYSGYWVKEESEIGVFKITYPKEEELLFGPYTSLITLYVKDGN